MVCFFFSSRRRHTRSYGDWSSDVCSSDLAWVALGALNALAPPFGPVGDVWPDSFAHAYVPARFDVRGRGIFDVAHNPDGARVLADTLREYDPPHPRARWSACWATRTTSG